VGFLRRKTPKQFRFAELRGYRLFIARRRWLIDAAGNNTSNKLTI
jgi:hypothetical protein